MNDDEEFVLRQVANAGFTLALDYWIHGPRIFRSSFPKAWQEQYELHSYFNKDPVLFAAATAPRIKRWSEVRGVTRSHVMTHAAEFGLCFGAIVSRRSRKGLSFLSAARSDRELTDSELELVKSAFKSFGLRDAKQQVLSVRLKRVVMMLSEGHRLEEIATREDVSIAAVKSRLVEARRILGAKTNAELVARALRSGLI